MRPPRPHLLPRLASEKFRWLGLSSGEAKVIKTMRACYARHGQVLFGFGCMAAYEIGLLWRLARQAIDFGLLPADCECHEYGPVEDQEADPDDTTKAEIETRLLLLRRAKQIAARVRHYTDLHSWELDTLLPSDDCGPGDERVQQEGTSCPECGQEMRAVGRAGRGRRCYACQPGGPRFGTKQWREQPCPS